MKKIYMNFFAFFVLFVSRWNGC